VALEKRPVIGLSSYVDPITYGSTSEVAAFLPISYVTSVGRAGGYAVLLPPAPAPAPADPGAALAAVDGLVVTGGPDIDPARYGAAPHPKSGRPRPERDAWEIGLCRAALEEEVPLLAICRGVQVLNVTLGGSLHQHLPDVVGTSDHRPKVGELSANPITLDAGSRAASILGMHTDGLCHHHQAIDRLGEGMQAVGFAADGTVEAVEIPGATFALGVQWHPEDNPQDDRLFEALVDAARAHRAGRGNRTLSAGA
jgi:gamma-glutamyl-gamma-aminobutyrate hydrolase PuuD